MTRVKWLVVSVALATAAALVITPVAFAQQASPKPPAAQKSATSSEYVIGPEDVLQVSVWKNDTLSRVVPVRPDGKISLPLLQDVQASGLTTMQLRDKISRALGEFMPNPEVSVIVKIGRAHV